MEDHKRLTTSYDTTLNRQLRADTTRFTFNRRVILGCSVLAAACSDLAPTKPRDNRHLESSLEYIKTIGLDREAVSSLRAAGSKDRFAMACFVLTGVLAAIGGKHREEHRPILPLLMALKTGMDTLATAKSTVRYATIHKRLSAPSLVAAGSSLLSAALSLPEARAALDRLLR